MCTVVVAALIPGLTLPPKPSPNPRLGRGAFICGVTAAATAVPAFAEEKFVAKRATDVAQLVGSGGLSSYNEMKLTTALKELADAPVSEDIKPSVDVISTALPLISQNKVPDGAKISQATDALASLVLTEGLQTRVATLAKQSAGIRAGIAKADANAAAVAAAALAEELTDFCYSYEGAQKPLAELRKGTPTLYEKGRATVELPVSGKSL